jgi:hypothetical protein
MSIMLTQSLTLKDIEHAILKKVDHRNKEMNNNYYSDAIKDYEFIDINIYPDHKLLLFRCPKSKSTVSLKIVNKENK